MIKVKTRTIDDWWIETGRPDIDLVKMDIEGAELLVLKGGGEFFSHVLPILLFELNTENLKPYPYDARDIIEVMEAKGYEIKNLDLSSLGGNQRNQVLSGKYSGEFMAVPKLKRSETNKE